ncbi:hypothetical protein [Streptomyces agglomeratus]|uniref:hypothetical protein n=1 Tax=Streptomyces agglomeratus TaxID=285458 RepID=UPI0008540C96|nr:hypothetical protein [Streptomyces agglomeratus]OEJ52365.1 hypothetical protein BGK72_17930 [Streptomyces agglomeratus]
MRRHGLTHGRRGAATGAAAVVLGLGGVLAACGGGNGDDDGYAAIGAAGRGPERAPGRAVPPEGGVELVPLDGDDASRGGARSGGDGRGSPAVGAEAGAAVPRDGRASKSDGPDAEGGDPGATHAPAAPGKPQAPDGGGSAGTGGGGGGTGGGDTPAKPPAGGSPGTPGPPGSPDSPGPPGDGPGTGDGSGGASPAPPAGPAVLKVGDPLLAPREKRWCEQVTVPFRNTGESAVRSGTVTFGTHIIGALGVDWGTRTSTQPLPGPIAAGAAVTKTYTVCVDAWRVPLGMRVETQDVTADWK